MASGAFAADAPLRGDRPCITCLVDPPAILRKQLQAQQKHHTLTAQQVLLAWKKKHIASHLTE